MNKAKRANRMTAPRLALALATLACAQLITSLDFNIVYVALPEIGLRLGFSTQSLQWVFSAYSVMFGGLLLLGGRAADLFGRRRMFNLGLFLYAAASLAGGLAQSPIEMIVMRGIQGAGGAILFPATLSLINTLFEEGPARNRALGLWSLAGSSGLTLGSIAGGVLVGTLGWPSIFFVNVPIAALVAIGAFVAIPEDPPSAERVHIDLAGALTSTVGVTLLVFTLAQAPVQGWTSVLTYRGFGASAILLAVFVLIEAGAAQPLMPLGLLSRGRLAIAMVMTFLFMATFMALPYFTTDLFQRAFQFSPLQTGLAFLVPCLAIAIGTQLGSHLATRFGIRTLSVIGLTGGIVGATWIGINIIPGGDYVSLVPGLIVFGLGQGTAWPPMWIAAATDIPAEQQGIASGLASTTLWIGGAVGLAVLVAVASIHSNSESEVPSVLTVVASTRAAIFAIAGGIALILPVAFLLKGRPKPAVPNLSS